MNEAQLIHAAAFAVISDPDRWTQGYNARSDNTVTTSSYGASAVCWCSRGALISVSIRCNAKNVTIVEKALRAAVQKIEGHDFYALYNDTHTHEEVMQMWQLAGEILATQ